MDVDYEKAVDDLLKYGFAFVPVNAVAVSNAMGATRKLLGTIGDDPRWTLTRPGEGEADVGLILKSKKAGYDEKAYFHFAPDLPLLLGEAGVVESAQQKACLEIVGRLQRELRDVAVNVVSELQNRELLGYAMSSLLLTTFRLIEPYNTSGLRYLQYPDVAHQTGAKAHFDKSLLTIHLGDEGGELLILNKSDTWVTASPPPGMALVFFGVKVLYATDGELRPLRHKSTTLPGKVRTAMVMFVHADVGHQVVTAEDSYREFYEAHT